MVLLRTGWITENPFNKCTDKEGRAPCKSLYKDQLLEVGENTYSLKKTTFLFFTDYFPKVRSALPLGKPGDHYFASAYESASVSC